MAIWRVTISKYLIDGPYALKSWSNVYHVNAASSLEADLAATGIVDLEKTLYPDNVLIHRYSFHDPLVSGSGSSKTIAEAGSRSTGTVATQLPPWNVVIVKFNVPVGRASLKYLRLPLDESEVDSGSIAGALITTIETDYSEPLVARGDVTDESGQPFASGEVVAVVRNRQSGWHRRVRAGFHRGWVPD